jgi:HlyD family secretion protein
MQSRPLRRAFFLVLLIVLVGGASFAWKSMQRPGLPPGIASGNGRLEATEVDVATKVAGRLAMVAVREGDSVTRGQVVAELDAEDLKAQLRSAEAQVAQAQKAVDESHAGVRKSRTDVDLANKTLVRSRDLVRRGFISRDKLDRDQTGMEGAMAGMEQARSRVAEAGAAVVAAQGKADSLRATLDDTSLKSPIAGRVLYRLAEPGEVLAAGGKVLTLLALSDVYISIYLPTDQAGNVRIGSPARILLDAMPDGPIPARVVFVAPRSQFTPKEVETRNEREKLMFRVKVQVAPEWLAAHADMAKPGMPGLAYVQTADDAVWPEDLMLR